jgi:hypothetical protein
MKWGDLKFDDRGVAISVEFKTFYKRRVRLVMAKPHPLQWKQDYPFDPDEPEALVYLTQQKLPTTHRGIASSPCSKRNTTNSRRTIMDPEIIQIIEIFVAAIAVAIAFIQNHQKNRAVVEKTMRRPPSSSPRRSSWTQRPTRPR